MTNVIEAKRQKIDYKVHFRLGRNRRNREGRSRRESRRKCKSNTVLIARKVFAITLFRSFQYRCLSLLNRKNMLK